MKAVVLLLVLFLTPVYAAYAEENPRKGQAANIVEAIFRYQIGKHESEFYFLELIDKAGESVDPPSGFMRRFSDVKASMQKRTDVKFVRPLNVATDAASGKPGLVLTVSKLKWISDTEVEANGFVFAHGLNAEGYSYTLEKRTGKWIVTGDFLTGMS